MNDNMQEWKRLIDSTYDELFAEELDQEAFYRNMVAWRNALKDEFIEIYPAPKPEELFCDDMLEWKELLKGLFSDNNFPPGPSEDNPKKLAELRSRLNQDFAHMFPQDIVREWKSTLAYESLWVNYRIDILGNLNTEGDIVDNCYRVRLSSDRYFDGLTDPPYNEYHTSNWTGIDCSGFLQRAAHGHTALPDLGDGRFTWMGTGSWPTARKCSQIENGYNGTQYTEFIGRHPDHDHYNQADDTYDRTAPGYVLIKDGHVAIVQYVLGERGNNNERDPVGRIDDNIWLIQSIGGEDGPNGFSDK
ncbi:MAG: hypothetical protein GF344_06185 [Chitinivibrionales bacterium]|nr:hypothetical protein [Chitinivibrionales bacterium]